ncbi:response regulator transcription factor [Sphingobacterium phlebotomi]|uniref:Response regulator transcription factor n=1 Tax=Sphingobacterium phlebotomi TaxID=2605433 RepID=A0A5D4H9Z8_9SPHI|nr:LytTR family DNA-binding domain-containing protein [Sphingobacterium phlebotomi]TYR37424.1 response regulator transcription factor [Sphingobacterium phlebotomi]
MINCIVIEDEPLAQEAIVSDIRKIHNVNILGVFDNALDALPAIQTGKVDLVFSDIQMPEIDGVSFLKSLKKPPMFVFVTGNPQYALESFELDVVDYIRKPFNLDRILKAVNKANALMESRKTNVPDRNFLIVKDRSSLIIVQYNEVYFIKSDKDYIKIFTAEKDYVMYKSLGEIEESLSSARQFLRVQKSHIVNLDFASSVEGSYIKMRGSIKDIPVGGQYRAELYRRLGVKNSD